MTITAPTKRCSDLVVGDVLQLWGESRTITGFASHPGLDREGKHHKARVALSGDWGMTCFDDESVRLTSSGSWISNHLWFPWEKRHGR